jgi:hypothetical protein
MHKLALPFLLVLLLTATGCGHTPAGGKGYLLLASTIGPIDAGIERLPSAVAAPRRIADKHAPFVSRDDKSGTHVEEMDLWAKACMKPEGAWCRVYQQGAAGTSK